MPPRPPPVFNSFLDPIFLFHSPARLHSASGLDGLHLQQLVEITLLIVTQALRQSALSFMQATK
jgi:hypothetical protein